MGPIFYLKHGGADKKLWDAITDQRGPTSNGPNTPPLIFLQFPLPTIFLQNILIFNFKTHLGHVTTIVLGKEKGAERGRVVAGS